MADFNIADLWELLADAAEDNEVLVAGTQRRTYRQLEERANRLANHLLAAGVRPGDHVGLYSFNRAEFFEVLIATWKIRAVPININYRYVEHELRYLLSDSECVAMVYERRYGDRLAALADELPGLTAYIALGDDEAVDPADDVATAVPYEQALAAASPAREFGPRSADDIYIVYTGGTTGMPKGTMWRHEDIFFGALGGGGWPGTPVGTPEEIVRNAARDFRMTFMPVAPLMHGAAQWYATGGILAGHRIVLYTGRTFDAAELLGIIAAEKVNSVQIVGDAMARPLAGAVRDGDHDLSSWYGIGSGGAVFSEPVQAELKSLVPQLTINDSYGSSELGAGGNGVAKDAGANPGGPRFRMDPNVTVLDEITLRPLEPGTGRVGRIARTGHIPLGYWKDEAKTAETFPTVDGVRYVVPGDHGLLEADGTIVMLGRGSVCINSGGEKIYPEEVEVALKAHPAVYDTVVVGVPDERWGSRVVAVIATTEGESATYDELAAHARTLVAGYKVPREIVFVPELVRTNVGKADYKWAAAVAAGTV